MSTGSNSPDEPTGELPRRGPDATSGVQPGIEPARKSRAEAAEIAETTGRSGDTIGPFRLIEMIGEGGFGEVWLAERREPMVQRVALKIIKPGMDSKAVVARFEQERQALADLYWNLGLNQISFPLQESALETRRRVLGEDHPDTLLSLNHMGVLLKDEGRLREAEPYLREAVEKRKRVLGEDHPRTLVMSVNLGMLLNRLGKSDDASRLLEEAIANMRCVLGDEHPTTMRSLGNLARVRMSQGRHAEAEPLLLEAYEKQLRILGDAHPSILKAMGDIVDLYTAWEKAEPGKAYQAKAGEWQARLDAAAKAMGATKVE